MNLSSYSRYSPFGILVRKDWLFRLGGRPAIYQPEAEFELLPETVRWRHVRYEPGAVDFTWEREWRVQCDELRLEPANAEIVVPAGRWAASLVDQHDTTEELRVEQYSQVMEDVLAEQYRESFPWRVNTFESVTARAEPAAAADALARAAEL